MKKIKYYLEYRVLRIAVYFFSLLPYPVALRVSDFLGSLAFSLVRIRRKETLANLRLAFFDKTEAEIKKIALHSYKIQARAFLEYALYPQLEKKKIFEYVEFEGLENFDAVLRQKTGAILVGAHFGSWQLMGAALRYKGYPMNFLVQVQKNHLIDKLLDRYYSVRNIGVTKRGESVKEIIQLIKENKFVAFLADQDAGEEGIILDFLGKPASVHKGPAVLALKLKAPIIMGFITHTNRIHQKITILPALRGDENQDFEANVKKLTQAYADIWATYIKNYPDHWFWQHRRWKSTLKDLY